MEEEELEKLDKKACYSIRQNLRDCISNSDCVTKEKKNPRECLTKHFTTLPEECQKLSRLLYYCRRSMIDNRQRFREKPS